MKTIRQTAISRSRLILALLGVLLTGLTPQPAAGQAEQEEAPVIRTITIEFRGVKNVSEGVVRANIQIKEGEKYEQTLADRSIRSLYNTGFFDFIELKSEEVADGRVDLIIVVQPKYRIQQIRYVGNNKAPYSRLDEKISSKEGGILDERTIRKDRDTIYEYYLNRGFSQVNVDYDIGRDPVTGFGTVTFIVDEGRKLKIKSLKFVGNESASTRKLKKSIQTKKWGFFSWITSSGRFDENKFQEDLDILRDIYKDLGHLDVNISEANVVLVYPTAKTIAITINIDEGRQYRVGRIDMEGNTLFQTKDLVRVLELKPGDVFSPTKLDEDRGTLQDVFGRVGYLDTYVRADRTPNLQTGAIDITFHIQESDRFILESIKIEGNNKTKSVVILRELALAPGSTFDLVRMKTSETRLKNTQFFDEVRLTPESTNIPGRRNLKISLLEASTGRFSFGAGFSSLQKGTVFAELSQGNFDLFNWRSFFQGDGQKFRLRLSLGSRQSSFILYFEEPWLFEKQLAFGFELFSTKTDFNSTIFNEVRTGFDVFLRKRLIGLLVGRLSYRLENVDITDVASNAPFIIREEAGKRTVSKVTLTLVRDSRNHILFPNRGGRTIFSTAFAGLGGNTEYLKFEARTSKFFRTFKFLDQTVAILGRAGTFADYGNERVPFFDRFFLGGPDDLRGFQFRRVGPRDEDTQDGTRTPTFDPIGGNTYGFASVEYIFKIADQLRLAAFYDWGFLNSGNADFSPKNYNDNWGIGVRIMMLGSPMRLDYGIPITTDIFNQNDGPEFNFSFGSRF